MKIFYHFYNFAILLAGSMGARDYHRGPPPPRYDPYYPPRDYEPRGMFY